MKSGTQCSTAVGVFQDRAHAQQAVNELRRLGFREDEIGVAVRDGESIKGAKDVSSHAATGAAAGVATGAGLGALWGIGIAAGLLPAIGPAIAGGTLASILSSAAAGAAAAGIAGALIGLGIPEEEARFYEEEFKGGRTIVTVRSATRCDEARAVLRQFSGYDMHTRQTTGTAHAATGATGTTAERTTAGVGQKVQVREEELRAHKQPVETGEVRVRKEVHTEHKSIDVPVKKEEVIIERRPVTGRQVSGQEIREGEEIRIPVREEQVHVEKQPVVKEEVTVGKRQVQDTERVGGTVRKEEIKVEKTGDVDVKQHDQRRK